MPEQGQVVVVNTTLIIALTLASQLQLLQQLYTEVVIPPAVKAEIMAGGADELALLSLRWLPGSVWCLRFAES